MLVTALVTPFAAGGATPDVALYARMAAFGRDQGVDQLLVAGTTGEGSSLSDREREMLLDSVLEVAPPEAVMVALGAGPLEQVIDRGRAALRRGVRSLLLVDCPYIGAASAALREAWYAPVALALPEARVFPYVIPGRTGSALLPEDLARLAEDHECIAGVKDATGTLESKRRVRALCGDRLTLLCGDDHLLGAALADPEIRADGAVTFGANLAPALYASVMARAASAEGTTALEGDALARVAALVAIEADELLSVGARTLSVTQRYRNPLPVKAALEMLDVAPAVCRAPLAPMGPAGQRALHAAVQQLIAHPALPLAALKTHFSTSAPSVRPATLPS